MEFLLDSVILIDHFNNIRLATEYINQTGGKAAISVITWAETLTGFDNENRPVAAAFLDFFPVLDITKMNRINPGNEYPCR